MLGYVADSLDRRAVFKSGEGVRGASGGLCTGVLGVKGRAGVTTTRIFVTANQVSSFCQTTHLVFLHAVKIHCEQVRVRMAVWCSGL